MKTDGTVSEIYLQHWERGFVSKYELKKRALTYPDLTIPRI